MVTVQRVACQPGSALRPETQCFTKLRERCDRVFIFPNKSQLDVQIAARGDRLPNPDLRGEDLPCERRKRQGSLIMTGVQNDFLVETESAVSDSSYQSRRTHVPTNRFPYGC